MCSCSEREREMRYWLDLDGHITKKVKIQGDSFDGGAETYASLDWLADLEDCFEW